MNDTSSNLRNPKRFSTMAQVKYVAAGFLKDSENLLKEFVQENSTNFTVFSTKWKEHNFSLIFSGRDKHDLLQFTHEIFQVTLGYLQNSTIILQVGAAYLLYALYRNQISNPPIRIRITLPQWQILRKLKGIAEKNSYIHLHYIINFLYSNAFDFVEHGLLLGPCCSKGKTEENPPFHASLMLKDCKNTMSGFRKSNVLEEMLELSKKYAQLGQKVLLSNRNADDVELDEYADCLESLLNDGLRHKAKLSKKSIDADLGNRRARIKADQFAKKALFRQLNPSDSDEEYEPVEEQKVKQKRRHHKKKRVPKEKRRVGRPRKLILEKLLESDDGQESDHGLKVKIPKKRGPTHRGGYLEKYELKVPTINETLFQDFLQDDILNLSEEECKKEISDDITSDNLEKAYCKEETEDGDVDEPIYELF